MNLDKTRLRYIYVVWSAMKRRCFNQKHISFRNYGGRGISVCDRWMIFENFASDMGVRPKGCSIERIDGSGNYEPSNCKWATLAEQARNRRTNVNVTIDGKTQCLADWCRQYGTPKALAVQRMKKGWNAIDAIMKPPIPRHLRGLGKPSCQHHSQDS